jgi:hypothetical protein
MEVSDDGEVRVDHYDALLPDGSTLSCRDDARPARGR